MTPRAASTPVSGSKPAAAKSAGKTAARLAPARAATAAKPRARDAIALLKADHAEVRKLHKQYQKLADAQASAGSRGALARQICQALTAHASAEEAVFYPAARQALDETDLVDHADVEHGSAKALIAQIEALQPDDSHFDATVLVLCEYVDHHVKEEEGELFPACRASGQMDFKALGVAIAQHKAELMAAPTTPDARRSPSRAVPARPASPRADAAARKAA